MTTRTWMAGALAAALAVTTSAAETNADLEAQVRARETAFAKTMADRDHAAFQTFLADEAVFFGGGGPTRGKAAVAADWKRLYESPAAPFSWAPESVQVLDSGTLAISSGPVKNPQGENVGSFNSIWRREKGGEWLVVFDKGCP